MRDENFQETANNSAQHELRTKDDDLNVDRSQNMKSSEHF